MKENRRQEFIIRELEVINEEFEIYTNQLILLKPFLQDLILVAKGETPSYNMSELINKNLHSRSGIPARQHKAKSKKVQS